MHERARDNARKFGHSMVSVHKSSQWNDVPGEENGELDCKEPTCVLLVLKVDEVLDHLEVFELTIGLVTNLLQNKGQLVLVKHYYLLSTVEDKVQFLLKDHFYEVDECVLYLELLCLWKFYIFVNFLHLLAKKGDLVTVCHSLCLDFLNLQL